MAEVEQLVFADPRHTALVDCLIDIFREREVAVALYAEKERHDTDHAHLGTILLTFFLRGEGDGVLAFQIFIAGAYLLIREVVVHAHSGGSHGSVADGTVVLIVMVAEGVVAGCIPEPHLLGAVRTVQLVIAACQGLISILLRFPELGIGQRIGGLAVKKTLRTACQGQCYCKDWHD